MRNIILAAVIVSFLILAAPKKEPRAPNNVAWGQINGNMSNQTDLQTALDSKVNKSELPPPGQTQWGQISGNLVNQTDLQSALNSKTDKAISYPSQWGSISGDVHSQADLMNEIGTRAPAYSVVATETVAAYTLSSADNGLILSFNNTNPVTVTIPVGLKQGFSCLLVQSGTAPVTVTGTGVTIHQRQNLTKTAGQYAVLSVISYVKDVFVLSGDMQ